MARRGGPLGLGYLGRARTHMPRPPSASVGHHQAGGRLYAHAEVTNAAERDRIVAALKRNHARPSTADMGDGVWWVIVSYNHYDLLDDVAGERTGMYR